MHREYTGVYKLLFHLLNGKDLRPWNLAVQALWILYVSQIIILARMSRYDSSSRAMDNKYRASNT